MLKFKALSIFLIASVFSIPVFCQVLVNAPESAAYDPIRRCYLLSDQGNGDIIRVDSLGNIDTIFTTWSISKGLLVRNDTLFVAAGPTGLIGINLETDETIMSVYISGQNNLNDVAADSADNIYVSDAQGNKVHKVHLPDLSTSTILTNFTMANGLWYDHYNNRLLAVQWIENSPLTAIDLNDYTTSNVIDNCQDFPDGITRDIFGNYYISSFGADAVYKYDSLFSTAGELYSAGHIDPGDIYVDKWNNILVVPCVTGGRVDFVEMFNSFDADTTWGFPPLEINFNGSSELDVDSWTWDFGDGDSAFVQSPAHTYLNPGMFDVTLEINAGGEIFTRTKKNYIITLSDTLKALEAKGKAGETAVVILNAVTTIPINMLKIPVEYQGALGLTLDSFSTAGCRTEHFDYITMTSSDPVNRLAYFKIYNEYSSGTPGLDPGEGDVLKLFFTVQPLAPPGIDNPIIIDGYSSRTLSFTSPFFTYTPIDISGAVSVFVCGDVDDNGAVNILDITGLISFLYKGGAAPQWPEQANVNNDASINILDITYLIGFLYKGGADPVCP